MIRFDQRVFLRLAVQKKEVGEKSLCHRSTEEVEEEVKCLFVCYSVQSDLEMYDVSGLDNEQSRPAWFLN